MRSGGPAEEPEDLELPYWGGHIPLHLTLGAPIPDEHVLPSARPPRLSIEDRRASK